jgi:hypothetical protein
MRTSVAGDAKSAQVRDAYWAGTNSEFHPKPTVEIVPQRVQSQNTRDERGLATGGWTHTEKCQCRKKGDNRTKSRAF